MMEDETKNAIRTVKYELANLNLVATSEILVYPEYPSGWRANVGIYTDIVFVVTRFYGHVHRDFQHCHGFLPNGSMILKDCVNNPIAICRWLDRELAHKLQRLKMLDSYLRT